MKEKKLFNAQKQVHENNNSNNKNIMAWMQQIDKMEIKAWLTQKGQYNNESY